MKRVERLFGFLLQLGRGRHAAPEFDVVTDNKGRVWPIQRAKKRRQYVIKDDFGSFTAHIESIEFVQYDADRWIASVKVKES